MNQILIFSTAKSNRLLFVLDFIFNSVTDLSYQVTDDVQIYKQLEGGKINYSNRAICLSEMWVMPGGLLEEIAHTDVKPAISRERATPFLFPVNAATGADCYYFDIFSAIFFMLSRYEEYRHPAKDEFGKFPPKESLAFKNNFLQLPVVDIWLKEFFEAVSAQNHWLVFPEKKIRVNFTYDIDVAYAYQGRGVARQVGAIGKDFLKGNFSRLITRFKVLNARTKDPFNNYDYMSATGINPIFFFLLHEKLSPQDRNISPATPLLRQLIKRIQQQFPIGIHPSFKSSTQTSLLQSEKQMLQQISGRPITKSRQHYLKFTWPSTYQTLANKGILEEYSMGFAQMPGFRAGTCTPFFFFDLEKNETTSMKIFPLCIMESTFRDDMVMPVQQALTYFIDYFEAVNKVKGHFICIWHNDTLQVNKNEKDPKNFRWLHDQVVKYIRTKER